MYDLLLAGLILAAVCAGLFFAARRFVERRGAWVALCVAGAAVLLVCLFGWFVHGKLLVAAVLPFSGAIILGNGIAPAAAVLAGVVAGQKRVAGERCVPRWRRGLLAAALLGLGLYSVVGPFLARPVSARDVWTGDGVCMQSCAASCSPASAATMLKQHGIAATEQEMIGLCLTGDAGTPSLGLYRGLYLKTQGTPWRVELVRGTVEELLTSRAGPVLLRIRLETAEKSPSDGRWTWSPGIGHAVVCYGLGPDGSVEIGDPALGRDRWTVEHLKTRWRGEGLRLVRRSGE